MMKKFFAVLLSVTILMGTVSFSGCIGSFNLTKKVYNWNQSVGDKWVNELVFLVFLVVPVYEISLFIDGIILNLIEFWSGNNPVSFVGEDGKNYVKAGNETYEMIKNRKQVVFQRINTEGDDIFQVIIDKKSKTAFINQNGKLTQIAEYNDSEGAPAPFVVYKPTGEAVMVQTGPDLKQEFLEAWSTSEAFAIAK